MKLKFLFMTLLGAAVLVGCNNEIDGGGNGPEVDDQGRPIATGESTTATFSLKFKQAGTYAGGTSEAGTTFENQRTNAAMFIYKQDGTPEAMAFLSSIGTGDVNAASEPMITLKCKSGLKQIYVALNVGASDASKLINFELGSTWASNTVTPAFLGQDWNLAGSYGPKFSDEYIDASTTAHKALNTPIWATASGFEIDTLASGPSNTGVNPLIQALTGNGIPGNGAVTGNGSTTSYYLMSNWGDINNSPGDIVGSHDPDYAATCVFTLEPGISADASRDPLATPLDNAIKINVQRAVAKVSVAYASGLASILTPTGASVGTGSNSGTFVSDSKWALGNINCSTYPFQMWSGNMIKSTRFDENAPIIPAAGNQKWKMKMDNSRFTAAAESYELQNLTVMNTRTQIQTTNTTNLAFGAANYVLSTENSSKNTYNQYTTFIVFAGQYKPASFVTTVSNVGTVTSSTTFPTTWPATIPQSGTTDTMHFVSTLGANGMFFLGTKALQEYVCYALGEGTGMAPQDPYTDPGVTAYINNLKLTEKDKQAKLQSYFNGYCFYRVWIDDIDGGSNRVVVRRNHVYNITISSIKGPGIGDPNDIIDPHPEEPDPIIEADTYVTATIEIMKWHIVAQNAEPELN